MNQIETRTKIAELLNLMLDNCTAQEIESELKEPAKMSIHVYATAQHLAESMDQQVAAGQDCEEGFNERHQLLAEILDASPWTMHPDHGLVLKADVGSLDAKAAALETEMFEATKPAWLTGMTKSWTAAGAQLCTKDGRVTGNAVLTGDKKTTNGKVFYVIVTDVGTRLTLSEEELQSMFHQPRFTMNVETHPGVLRLAGAEQVHPQSGLTADQLWWQTGELRAQIADLKAEQKKASQVTESLTNDDLDLHLDRILRAAGSALKHYTMAKSKDDMRSALLNAIKNPKAAQA